MIQQQVDSYKKHNGVDILVFMMEYILLHLTHEYIKEDKKPDQDLFIALGLIYYSKLDHIEGIQYYLKALSYTPHDYPLWNKIGFGFSTARPVTIIIEPAKRLKYQNFAIEAFNHALDRILYKIFKEV